MASRSRRASGNVVEGYALQFIDNMLWNYSDSIDTCTLLERSLDGRFAFCKEVQGAIRKYALSSDARQAFSTLLRSDSYALRGVASAVAHRLDDGSELRMQLAEVRKHVMQRNGKGLKGVRALGGALSITQVGAAVFFPAFAGISLNIMQFTAGMRGAGPGAAALTAVFAFYIAYTNLLNFKYDMKESAAARAEKVALSCAAAMLVFRAAAALSMGML
jgi:hypothetical protein